MYSIIIPVFNEAEILETTLMTLKGYLGQRSGEHEIVVVSNGSTDDTCAIGKKLARRFSWLKFLELPEKGVGRAFAAGVRASEGELVISLDADLSSDLVFVDFAIELLRHADMVVGSKTLGKQRRSAVRVIGSQTYLMFSSLALGLTISDYSIGCKAYRRASILPVLDLIDWHTGYVAELCLFLDRNQRRIVQVGVQCEDRRKSRFNLWHEARHRFHHLYHCWRLLKDQTSWIHTVRPGVMASQEKLPFRANGH